MASRFPPLEAVRLHAVQEICSGVVVLRFERRHDFQAGQVLGVTLDRHLPPRLYSLCSGTGDPDAEILFNIKPDGVLTPRLATCRPGDTLLVTPPSGNFTGMDPQAWWIAAGTGIAPYRSMLRSGQTPGMLVHGGRTADRFYFADEMLEAFGTRYVRCCSQGAGEGLFAGRLTQWLREGPLPPDRQYCLCGSAEMVVEVREILLANGITLDRIVSEIYF